MCISCYSRCWLINWGWCWTISSLSLKIPLSVEGKFWIQCSLLMNAWIVGWRVIYWVWFVSLTLKKHMIMWIEISCFISWVGWVLGWNGGGGLRLVSFCLFSRWIPWRSFWKLTRIETWWPFIPSYFSVDYGGLKQDSEEDRGEWSYSGFSCGTSEFCQCAYLPFVVCRWHYFILLCF